jgi:hypothetical protein
MLGVFFSSYPTSGPDTGVTEDAGRRVPLFLRIDE